MEEGFHLFCLHRTLLSVHRTASSPLCGTTGLCFVLQTLWKQVQAQFVDQQEQQLLPPWSKQTGAWALSVPVFSSPILFGIITPVVQGLIPAETWEPGTRGLRRSSVGREEGALSKCILGLQPPWAPGATFVGQQVAEEADLNRLWTRTVLQKSGVNYKLPNVVLLSLFSCI